LLLVALFMMIGWKCSRHDGPLLSLAVLQVDEIPLPRPKRNLCRDFSDAVLVAEVNRVDGLLVLKHGMTVAVAFSGQENCQ